jgi:hypothetical protein
VRLSSDTFQLWSDAHKLGDEYYRGLTDLHCNGQGTREQCQSIAARYLAALEDLEKHVSTLDGSEEAAAIQKSTLTFIRLIRGDLALFAEYSTSTPQDGHKRMIRSRSSKTDTPSPDHDGNL